MNYTQDVLELTADLVSEVDRDHRADEVLRRRFSRGSRLSSSLRREVSLGLFNYFRWLGLVDRNKPLTTKVRQVEELSQSYSENPSDFSLDRLLPLVPDWLSSKMPVTEDWLRSIQSAPQLWIRSRRGMEDQMGELGSDLTAASPAPGPGAYKFTGETDLFQTESFRAGAFEIQDLSSQWVGAFCDPKAGESWWDVCAGEGGKFLDLADRMENRGLIWATDRSSRRLVRLKQRAKRAKAFNYRSRQADLSSRAPFKVMFDGVLVDAPCSGIGTWQRNPDARWTSTPEDISALSLIQKDILKVAAGQVKLGGKLIYAVCTLADEETTGIADWFDAESLGFEPLSLPAMQGVGGDENAPWPNTEFRRWLGVVPGRGNGMFVAGWRRV